MMKTAMLKRSAIFGLLAVLAVVANGCSQPAADSGSTEVSAVSHEDGDGHDHSGWWCAEHGIPEEECSMCSSKAADEFKAKGDWCIEHNRAESQCFKCDPSRAEKYAKLYEVKFGETPPTPID